MKDENESWSEGQMESAAVYTAANDTDCSSWDAGSSGAEWSEGQFESAAITILTPAADFVEARPTAPELGVQNDTELLAKRTRIAQVLDQLAQLRSNGRPDEFAQISREARAEVERLQGEVLDYLTRPAG
jgi:hypothetical protein